MREPRYASIPALCRLYSPVIYAAVSSLAVREAEAYVGASGIEYDWGHVRWEAVPKRNPAVGPSSGDHVDWCFVIKRLQQPTASRPHTLGDAQGLLETLVRARLGRQQQVRIERPGPITMLRLRVKAVNASEAWASLADMFEQIPMWARIIDYCLPGGAQPAMEPSHESSTGELLQEYK